MSIVSLAYETHLVKRKCLYHRPDRATSILCGVMRMIPGMAVKLSLEGVCHARSGHDGTLCDTRHAILLIRSRHQGAVPVKTCSLISKIIRHFDLDRITIIRFYQRSRKLTVDADGALGLYAIRSNITRRDGEVVRAHGAFRRGCIWVRAVGRDFSPGCLSGVASATTVILW